MIKLPTETQEPIFDIDHLSMVIYGQPKIGKSTFCSRFENALFMATEPGLNYLKTKNVRVNDLAEACELVELLGKTKHPYKTMIVDTVDQLWSFCSEYVRKSRNVESIVDIPYGKGKDLVRNVFSDLIAKIVRLNMGMVFVSHAQMADVETVNGKLGKFLPTIPEKAREIILPLVDVIGFATSEVIYTADGERVEKRLLRVAPSSIWEAGDRSGRLKDPMPLNFHIFKRQYVGKSEEASSIGESASRVYRVSQDMAEEEEKTKAEAAN